MQFIKVYKGKAILRTYTSFFIISFLIITNKKLQRLWPLFSDD